MYRNRIALTVSIYADYCECISYSWKVAVLLLKLNGFYIKSQNNFLKNKNIVSVNMFYSKNEYHVK